ncbi:hypothetical protein Fmac_024826 [Flemingia macrophylla]|uniref:Uncharacterized protein n=1 Tax=Flemingia macrophylla TaxID=520843 RepID=A0ABD1LQG5_9FABA
MIILRLKLQTSIAGHHRSRGQTLDREDGFQLLAVSVQEMMPFFGARNDAIVIRGLHDVASDTSAENRRVEGKLDALVKLVTQHAVNQKPASVARVCGIRSSNDHHTNVEAKLDALVNLVTQLAVNQKLASVARVCGIRSSKDHHTNRRWLPTPSNFGARNDAIVIRGVHDVATYTLAETRKVEGKLDALVKMVTQLAVNQKPASAARIYGIYSSDDHHTNVWVNDVATDTPVETRKVEGKLDAIVNLVTQLAVNQKLAFVARVYGIRSSRVNDVATDTPAKTRKVEGKLDALLNLVTQLAMNQKLAFVARVYGSRSSSRHSSRGVNNVATDTPAKTRKVEGKLDALVNLVTQLAVNQKPASVARQPGLNEHPEAYAANIYNKPPQQQSTSNDAIVIKGIDDVATDTSAETIKVEGKLDALVNMGTQLAMNEKPASVARVYGIHSSNDYHTNVCPSSFGARNDAIVIKGVHDVATDISAETRKAEGKLDALVNLVTKLAVSQMPASVARVYGVRSSNDNQTNRRWLAIHSSFSTRNDAIVIRGVHEVATDTSSETRKVEGKLDDLVNLVTQLAVNQKHASVARVCGIRSSNDHHTNRRWLPIPSSFGVRNDAIVIRGVHEVATDTFAETSRVEGKLDALVNLVTQLAVNHFSARNEALVIRGVHDVATDTSVETRKVESKLDALVNLVAQPAVNQKPASVARQPGVNEHHEAYAANIYSRPPQESERRTLDREDGFQLLAVSVQEMMPFSLEEFTKRLQIHLLKLERVAHEVATDTFSETSKVEGKLDALVNLVTHLAVNQKPASVARVCDHSRRGQTLDREDGFQLLAVSVQEMMPFSLGEFTKWLQIHLLKMERSYGVRNDAIVIRVVHEVARDTFAETSKVEGKLDDLVNLVTRLAVNQKPASVAIVCGIRSSNDHHTNVCPSSSHPGVNEHPEAYAANIYWTPLQQGVHEVATDISSETRKVEGNLDALVNLVTQLVVNKKFASIARRRWLPTPSSFGTRNDAIVIRGVQEVATETSAETRKVEGKLDALMNLVTQLAVNQKPAFVARVCGIRSSNNHHTNRRWLPNPSSFSARTDANVIRGVHEVATDTFAETSKVEGKLDALVNLVTQLAVNQKPASVARFGARNDVIVIRGVHDVPTDTSAETRMVEGKLDALVNLVTQLDMNQKPASVATVCDIRSSKDHHTNRRWLPAPSSFSARNPSIVISGVHDVATDTSAKTRKVEDKLYALVNLVTQLAQPGENEHPEAYAVNIYSRPPQKQSQTLDREDGFQLLAISVQEMMPFSSEKFTTRLHIYLLKLQSARNDAVVIRGVHDVATDTSAETRKVEGKLDAHVNLVTQLAVNQKPAFVASVCGIRSSNHYHTNLYTSAETRMVEAKLDAIMNLVTQLAVSRKPASIARVCQTLDREDGFQLLVVLVQEKMPLSLEEFTTWLQIHLLKLESFSARNDATVIRGVHGVATDTSTETRKVEGKLDAFVNLVTHLSVSHKPSSVARVCGIRSSNDHHTNVYPSSYFSARNGAIVIRGVHDVATNISPETRKVEGKLDALVNLVTQLAMNQKPGCVARVCGIRSSNDHHTNVFHDVAKDTSAETRKVEGKLDTIVNLVTQLAVNQKHASVAIVNGIRSSNDHHTKATTAAEARHLIKKMASLVENRSFKPVLRDFLNLFREPV